ncbi:DNA internalization-related competence protein ComEC/Rec2 [Undibacterium sp. Di24W]|uniref:DNA internalization-related competence protein ComEC/Rec2 n=1 Tax=Undibacterium sp. Di24W TaxID=3413033 RepID=UPI003BF2C4CE
MRLALIGFAVGVALLQQQDELLPLWAYIVCPVSLFLLLVFPLQRKLASRLQQEYQLWLQTKLQLKLQLRLGLQILFAVLLGFCWAGTYAHFYLSEQLPSALENRDLQITGVIDNLPNRVPQGVRFDFLVEKYDAIAEPVSIDGAALPRLPSRLALGWFDQPSNPIAVADLRPGQRWQLTVRLKRPHGNSNPDGFDYEVWLLEQGIRATGSVRASTSENTAAAANQFQQEFVWSLHNLNQRARYFLREKIMSTLGEATYAGVIAALVIGDQRDITQRDWQIFNRTGIGHLISISGLHITMIAGIFASLMYYLWRHSFFTQAQLPLRLPAPKVATIAGVVAAFIYVALAGFGVPAQRTLWMLLVVAIAVWSGRTASITHILCIALGLVLLLDPWAVMSPGFYLSFAAVGVLLFASLGRYHFPVKTNDDTQSISTWTVRWQVIGEKLYLAGRAQYAVTMGLVPLSLLLFAQVSIISPIANAIAIPLVSFVVTPLALSGSVLPAPVSTLLLTLAHELISLLAQFLTMLSKNSWAVWRAPIPSWWMFALAMIGVLWMLMPRGWPLRFLGVICCLPVLLQPVSAPETGDMNVTVFDVGQGSAVLIETAKHRMLYDTGPGFSAEANAGTRVLLPYLQGRGIHRLDQLMITHSDSDHSGGALSLIQNLDIDLLSSSLVATHPIVLAAHQHRRCQAGQSWNWDGVQFEVLHPVPVIYTSSKWKSNALSCTLKISTKTHSLLLTGDIEAIQEDELVNSIPGKLKADVLLAPHHGSGTSSTTPFLQSVRPELALFQVGYLNRYQHPKPEVMQRYLDFGIKPLRTDTSGAITLQFGSVITVNEYRKDHARYWYSR